MNIDISEVITRMEKDFNRLESENARLRKALREIADSDSISRYRLIEMAEKALDRPESEAKAPNVTAQELVDDVDIPKTGYVQNSKPLQYPPDLENRQLQADNARLRQRNEQLVEFLLSIYNVLTAWKNEEFNTESEAGND